MRWVSAVPGWNTDDWGWYGWHLGSSGHIHIYSTSSFSYKKGWEGIIFIACVADESGVYVRHSLGMARQQKSLRLAAFGGRRVLVILTHEATCNVPDSGMPPCLVSLGSLKWGTIHVLLLESMLWGRGKDSCNSARA